MNENKNSENQGYLSGFDSVEQAPPKNEGNFNPTPMFSGMNRQNGYAVTPEGSFFTSDNKAEEKNSADASSPIKEGAEATSVDTPVAEPVVKQAAEPEAPAKPETPPVVKTEDTATVKSEPSPKAEAPVFIPSGTYSYSAAKGDLQSSAFETPDTKQSPPKKEDSYTAPSYTAPSYNTPTPPSPPVNDKPKKEKKPKKYGAGIIFIAALLAAIIGAGGGVFGVFFAQNNIFTDSNTALTSSNQNTVSAPQNVTNITVDETVNSSIEAVAKKAGPSIIGIRTTAAVTNFFGGSTEATGEGSGIIYTTDGYIITNYHVIESAVESSNSKVEVFLADDTETAIEATVIGYNIASDLAVVKIEKTGLPAIEFADSDKLSVGQYAIAIGNPGGLEFIGSVSSGVISGLNRSVTVGTGNAMSLIQTDAAINPGNSGGALVDIKGMLIGVNSVKLVSTGYEGMGFAIPSNTVKEICNNIIDKQNDPTPYIGIQISQNYTADELIALGYPAGAVVVSVVEGGPAYESKIQRGDIITEFNGVTVKNYTELENAIAQCKPGDSVTVKIFRAGRFYSSHINVAANNAQ